LRRALAELRPSLTDVSFRTIDLAHHVALEKETGAEAALPGQIILRLEYEHLLLAVNLEYMQDSQPQLPQGESQRLPIPGTVALEGGWLLTAVVADINLAAVRRNRDPWVAYLDVGQTTVLQVRSRIPGEYMQPLGMDGRSASVQDIMVNRKLPAALRAKWPLVATKEHALWLVGHIVDERAKVADNTRRIIRVSYHKKVTKR
jgi:tRNA(Ile)-lysidine synthase